MNRGSWYYATLKVFLLIAPYSSYEESSYGVVKC